MEKKRNKPAFQFGAPPRPKPATPCWPPLTIRYVPSGSPAMQGITLLEGYNFRQSRTGDFEMG